MTNRGVLVNDATICGIKSPIPPFHTPFSLYVSSMAINSSLDNNSPWSPLEAAARKTRGETVQVHWWFGYEMSPLQKLTF